MLQKHEAKPRGISADFAQNDTLARRKHQPLTMTAHFFIWKAPTDFLGLSGLLRIVLCYVFAKQEEFSVGIPKDIFAVLMRHGAVNGELKLRAEAVGVCIEFHIE